MAATAVAKIDIETSGAVRKLEKLDKETKDLSNSVNHTTNRFKGLQATLGRLALLETGRRMVNVAASFKQTELRLKLLSQEYGENAKAQLLAAKAAKVFGLSQSEALSGVADIYARLRPIGVELEDIESTFIGFNTAAKLSGVSAAAASGAFLQLAQALGSGRLQGDEFRSIAEQLPKLNQIIAKEMGVPIGQLKTLASQGKITSEIVINALKRIEREGAGKIASIMKDDPTQKFKNLSNAMEDLSRAVGNELLPGVTPLIEAVTNLVKWLGQVPEPLITAAAAFIAIGVAAGPVIGLLAKLKVAFLAVTKTVLAITTAVFGLKGALILLFATPIIAGIAALGAGIYYIHKQLSKGTEEAKKFNEAIANGSVPLSEAKTKADELTQQISKLKEEMEGLNPQQKRKSGLTAELEQAEKRLADLQAAIKKVTPTETDLEDIKKENELIALLEKRQKETEEGLEKQKVLVAELKGKWFEVGETIKQDVTSGIKDAIKGSKSLGETMSGVLNRIADHALDVAVNMALWGSGGGGGLFGGMFSGIFGGGGGGGNNKRQGGGPVSAGNSYLVGERGPEIFTPGRSGGITPNHKIEGGTTINVSVSATESSVAADDGTGKQLGSIIAAAIQQQLIQERRQGGLLST